MDIKSRLKQRDKKINRAILGFIITAALIVQMIASPYTGYNTKAAGSHETSGSLSFSNTMLDSVETLTDNGDGTYTFKMEIGTETSLTDKNMLSSEVHEGYFVAPYAGTYLIDLWGGDGADGDDSAEDKLGGLGGDGAHIYGEVILEKGQVIYYTLGGHGQKTAEEDVGGGANGDGGSMGNISTGSYMVGGGGGYSAVYLFEDYNEFASTYLDEEGNQVEDSILESDRTSKYIMVAGGGGGGGAGDGFTLFSETQVGRADGGNAGGFDSASGRIEGTGVVSGTFYAGSDGMSSGTSTEYIGHGGTNVPGIISDTVSTIFTGDRPNDWFATYDTTIKGGAGGAGDMRGGAGGAGYCGGSGGIMSSILYPMHVGGGGGGSSFVADCVKNVSESGQKKLTTENTNNQGGIINITLLPDTVTKSVNEVTLQIPELSEYFVLSESGIKATDTNGKVLNVSTVSNGYYTIEGVATFPTEEYEKMVVEFTFEPIDGFAGGNDVPIFKSEVNIVGIESDMEDDTSVNRKLTDGVCYVNVPLDFTATGNSYVKEDTTKVYQLAELYTDYYSEAREEASSYIQYDFIETIGTYNVSTEDGTILTEPVSPTETTKYKVSFEVSPKDGTKAVVGDKVTNTTYSAIAVITVPSMGTGTLGGNTINYTKKLTYDSESGLYNLSFNVASNIVKSFVNSPEKITCAYGDDTSTIVIPVSGYYVIQAWGGTGGTGEANLVGGKGGSGGAGGYVSDYCYFEQGTELIVSCGANGMDGATGQWFQRGNGTGGGYTSVTVEDDVLLIAGGGGGGGAASTEFLSPVDGGIGTSGSQGVSSKTEYPTTPIDTTYTGGTGNTTSGGSAGANFISTSMGISENDYPLLDTSYNDSNFNYSDYTNENGGAVYVTCIQVKNSESEIKSGNAEALNDYVLTADISDYFTVVTDTDDGYALSYSNVENESSKGEPKVELTDGNIITISEITPIVTHQKDTDNKQITSTIGYVVTISLKPIDGFIGGNDVILLETSSLGQGKEEPLVFAENPETDYANVGINYAFEKKSDGTEAFETFDLWMTKGEYTIDEVVDKIHDVNILPQPIPNLLWDYAEISQVEIREVNTQTPIELPTETTTYQVTVSVQPKADGSLAVIKGEAVKVSKTLTATVYVDYSVELTESSKNVALDNTSVDADADYAGILSADAGFVLPSSIIVKREGTLISSSSYTYDSETGKVSIPADVINKGNITIEAIATAKTYMVTAAYTTPNGKVVSNSKSFTAGTMIDPKAHTDLFVEPTAGTDYDAAEYTFRWDSLVQDAIDSNNSFEMVANNIIVMGNFIPKTYDITVKYMDGNGNPIDDVSEDAISDIAFGSTYSVTAREITGYKATGYTVQKVKSDDTTIEMGRGTSVVADVTMPAADVIVTFEYVKLVGSVIVTFVASDSNEVLLEKSYEVTTANTEYTFDLPAEIVNHVGYNVDGNALDKDGKIAYTTNANCDGANIIVYCNPKTYDITLDANGGNFGTNITTTTKTFQYNKPYSYTIDTEGNGTYGALPTPVRAGYIFLGWDKEQGSNDTAMVSQVKEADIVDGTVIRLYAKWTPVTYKVVVKFVDEDGISMGEDQSFDIAYGATYDVKSLLGSNIPSIQDGQEDELGYSSNASGTMPAQNIVVTVTYYYEEYGLTIRYIVMDSTGASAVWYTEEVEETIRYKEIYTVQKSFADAYAYAKTNDVTWPSGIISDTEGYEPLQDIITGTMPLVEDGKRHIVDYTFVCETPVVSVSVEWGELLYVYDLGNWNPQTHQYEELIKPYDSNKNYVTVTNSAASHIDVDVEFNYTCSDSTFGALDSVFSFIDNETDLQTASQVTVKNLGKKDEAAETTVWLNFTGSLWPNGVIPDNVLTDTYIPMGILQVTITGGDPK